MKFVQLILKKVIKIVVTRCQTFDIRKCTKFDFGWGSAPDPAGTSSDPLPGFEGPTSKGEGRAGIRGKEREEKEGGGGLSIDVAEEAFCLKSAPALAYIFAADSMGLSSFKFLRWAPKDASIL